jgi:hypothetical protein
MPARGVRVERLGYSFHRGRPQAVAAFVASETSHNLTNRRYLQFMALSSDRFTSFGRAINSASSPRLPHSISGVWGEESDDQLFRSRVVATPLGWKAHDAIRSSEIGLHRQNWLSPIETKDAATALKARTLDTAARVRPRSRRRADLSSVLQLRRCQHTGSFGTRSVALRNR